MGPGAHECGEPRDALQPSRAPRAGRAALCLAPLPAPSIWHSLARAQAFKPAACSTRYQEKFYFNPGDTGFKVFDTAYGRFGAGICWDQWFPECARAMALQGAEVRAAGCVLLARSRA